MNSHRAHRGHRGHNDFSATSVTSVANSLRIFGVGISPLNTQFQKSCGEYRHRLVIVNFPDSFEVFHSPPACLTRRCGTVSSNSTGNPTISCFSDGNQPDSSTAPLLVIAIASADQLVAVTFEELLCAFLTKGQ